MSSSTARRTLSRPSNSQAPAGSSSQTQSRRSSNNRVARGSDEEDEGGNDGEDVYADLMAPLPKPQVDPQYRNQKIPKDAALSKLNILVKEWNVVVKKIEASMILLANATADLQEALALNAQADDESEDIEQADADYRLLIDKLYEAKTRKAAVEEVRHKAQLDERVNDPFDFIEKYATEKMTAYNSQTARQKYKTNEQYLGFRTQVWEAEGGDAGMPALKRLIAREGADPESSDDEIEVQQGAQNFKDPLTMVWLVNPVKNSQCKHIFSKEVITNFIKSSANKTSVQCPVAGCNKILKLEDLTEDPQLERRVKQHVRRQEEREDEAGGYQEIDDDEEEE